MSSSSDPYPLHRHTKPSRCRPQQWISVLGLVVLVFVLTLTGLSASAQETATQPPLDAHSDLGDAPDSLSNHHAISNTAYAGPVPGRFPTVWEKTPAGEGTGPLHRNPRVVWLGDHVSGEHDADLMPDVDGITNILQDSNGVADTADQDRGDDGWLNPSLPLPDCQEAVLRVRVTKDPTQQTRRMFLNVWIDGNRDGDWADQGRCGDNGHSNEWIVQNFVVDTASMAGSFADIDVKTILVYNAKPDATAWMRFSLSESASVSPPHEAGAATPPADGRGPDYPNAFELGETEDYRWTPRPPQDEQPRTDLGDAPDSDANHSGSNNTAYPGPGTLGHFPSVWEGTPAGQPSGPRHADAQIIWLGDRVSVEKDADLMPDADGMTNILNGGGDVANMDHFDDGWLDPKYVSFADCQDTRLKVRVSKINSANARVYLNVWFDGNRSGYWGERKRCSDGQPPKDDGSDGDIAHEWIVQNFPIDTSTFAGPVQDLAVPTMRVLNHLPDAEAWVRFTLSERPIERLPSGPFEHDGRGPDLPGMYQLGETEDYVWRPTKDDPNPEPDPEERADFGDAPDSTNHHGLTTLAYPSVNGRFPSVWNGTPAGQPSGPRHADPNQAWLGDHISGERDADLLPDMDGITNILDNGADAAKVDRDRGDDGWLNHDFALFKHCEATTLRVRVSKAAAAQTERMFLNVYYDGNRSGEWRQRVRCDDPQKPIEDDRGDIGHEWIVQNFVVDTMTIPAGGHVDLAVPTLKVMNLEGDKPAWIRFMLSEVPVQPLSPFEHDGRGPDQPAFFKLGETEDYLVRGPDEQGDPGKLIIHKDARHNAPVQIGDVITYSVVMTHAGGTAPASVKMVDELPAEVSLMRGPFVSEVNPHVAPLSVAFNASVGPSGAIEWMGTMSPNSVVRFTLTVRVRHCPPADRPLIRNVAVGKLADRPEQKAVSEIRMECERPTEPPQVVLHKRFYLEQSPDAPRPEDEPVLISGPRGVFELVLQSNGLQGSIQISDVVDHPVQPVHVEADRGAVSLSADGTVDWRVRVEPNSPPIRARIFVKPSDRIRCEDLIENVAHWQFTTENGVVYAGESNRVRVRYICHDLGDAPDSTNHAGAPMTAYPDGTAAQFPTVFNVAAPERGPMHRVAKPMHLGPRVTEETEADLGPDVDPSNNIVPRANAADRDERDDGLIWEKFKLEHCRVVRFPVLVSLDAAALASIPAGQEAFGYINVWIDSNRDGDWADVLECPNVAGTTGARTVEHIVIDHRIDVRALGPGLHTVYLTTSTPVFWDAKDAARPAWLRITLSEQPSNKPFSLGSLVYGDGRGHDKPFGLGETEDYLIRPVRPDQPELQEGADPVVSKRGTLTSQYDSSTGTSIWVAQWAVDYRNNGYATANNVVLTDRLEGVQTLTGYDSVPVSPTVSGNSLSYALGTLAPGQHGFVGLRSTLPMNTPPGTVITNTVTITAPNDASALNNSTVVTLTVPLLPPVITYPTPGTTCDGDLTVTGHSQPGTTVDVYIDGSLAGTVTPDASGNWSYSTTLADGTYNIYAVARLGSQSSAPSPTVQVIVDSSLFYDPLSLRFTDDAGHVSIPHDSSGRTDAIGWSIFLRRGTTYTVSVEICCDDPNAVVTLELGSIATITLTDPDNDGTYTATFTTPNTGPIQGTIRICVVCELIKRCSDGELTIDPEGTVFNVLTGNPVEGATVACLQAQTSGSEGQTVFNLWPAASFKQINPQTTGSDGYFSFFTPPGTYRVQIAANGYQSYVSRDLMVVAEPVHFDPPLTPAIEQVADYTIVVGPDGFEPQVIQVLPGSVIEWVNQDVAVHATVSITPTVSFEASAASLGSSDGWDSGLLFGGDRYKRQLNTLGSYHYYDSENPTNTATILVVEEIKLPEEPTNEIKLYLPTVNR